MKEIYVGYFDSIIEGDDGIHQEKTRYTGIILELSVEEIYLLYTHPPGRKKVNIPRYLKENTATIMKIDILEIIEDKKTYTDLTWKEIKKIISICCFPGYMWKTLVSLLKIDDPELYKLSVSDVILPI